MKPKFYLLLLLGLIATLASAQILHTESFSVILDTTQTIKGSIISDFKFQTQKKDLIEFERWTYESAVANHNAAPSEQLQSHLSNHQASRIGAARSKYLR